MSAGTLFVCGVPIGNVADASARLREVLERVDVIACEDTRVAGTLWQQLHIAAERPRLVQHHAHNERASAAGIVELLARGEDVALVTDAGTPGVSDPGAAVVDAVLERDMRVACVAGPSAVAAAVSVCGFAREDAAFWFGGFAPRSAGVLADLVRARARELVVLLESPRRLRATLAVLADVQTQRRVAVCRELTKRHEQIARGTATQLLQLLDDDVRGEIVLVLEPAAATRDHGDAHAPIDARALASDIAAAGVRAKDAAKLVARHTGGSARELYEELVTMRDTHS